MVLLFQCGSIKTILKSKERYKCKNQRVSVDLHRFFNKLSSLKMFNKVLESKCFFWAIVASYTNSYDKYFSKVSQGGKKNKNGYGTLSCIN